MKSNFKSLKKNPVKVAVKAEINPKKEVKLKGFALKKAKKN